MFAETEILPDDCLPHESNGTLSGPQSGRLGTNLSAQCYTNLGPVRWSDVVEFQGM